LPQRIEIGTAFAGRKIRAAFAFSMEGTAR